LYKKYLNSISTCKRSQQIQMSADYIPDVIRRKKYKHRSVSFMITILNIRLTLG